MSVQTASRVHECLSKFTAWLDSYGETSWDHQSYYAGPLGRRAKKLYYKRPLAGKAAVSFMVASEALFPAARRLFWKPQRLPIADAHYAMGYCFLARLTGDKDLYERALHFARVLEETRCPEYRHYGWGYPFDWVTRGGTIPRGTPLITTTPYVWEAFLQLYRHDGDTRWLPTLRSIAEHVMHDYHDSEIFPGADACSYTPLDSDGGVVNASAYRAVVLTGAAELFSNDEYCRQAERNLRFVLKAQRPDGSWPYSMDTTNGFVDHFHTCFVLKAIAKIELMTGYSGCRSALRRGVDYYVQNLFDKEGLPRPFAQAPRMTVYRHELYDYAECINIGTLLKGRYAALDLLCEKAVQDILSRWQKPDGSFRSRRLFAGWDNVPMHRWAQSQLFRSLCFLVHEEKRNCLSN